MIRRLAPLAASLVLLGCAAQMPTRMELPLIAPPGSKQTVFVELAPGKFEPSLMAIGSERDLAQERGRHMGFVPNPAIETYLGGIRERLLAASGVTDVPGTVRVIANTAYTARATADGNLFVSMAWLPDVESEDELAAIVAHELSHVLLKHQSSNLIGLTQKRLQSAHEMLISAQMSAKNTTQVGKSDQKAMMSAQIAVELLDKLAMPAWNRRQETEADLLGLDLMIRAGYSPDGMTAMLERLRDWEKANTKSSEALETQLKELVTKDPQLALNTAWKSLVDEVSREHPETDKRLETVADYIERHYADLDAPDLNAQALKKFRTARGVGPILKNYQHAVRAKVRLNEGNASAAYGEALQGVQPPTAKDTMPNWILWQTAKAVGRQGQHRKALDNALQAQEPILEVYKEAILINEQSGKFQVALNLVEAAVQQFGDAPEWAPDRIRLLKKLGRKHEAAALAVKCAVETPQLRKECHEAGKS